MKTILPEQMLTNDEAKLLIVNAANRVAFPALDYLFREMWLSIPKNRIGHYADRTVQALAGAALSLHSKFLSMERWPKMTAADKIVFTLSRFVGHETLVNLTRQFLDQVEHSDTEVVSFFHAIDQAAQKHYSNIKLSEGVPRANPQDQAAELPAAS